MKLLQCMGVAVLLQMTAGCSMVSIGYNNADLYLRYKINGYADFEREQRAEIHQEVDKYLVWHRKVMLPEYAVFLREIQRKVDIGGAPGEEEIRDFRFRVRKLYISTLQPTVIPASRILHGMTVSQAEDVQKSLDKENSKLRDNELSGNLEQRLRLRNEKIIEFIENLVGGLNDRQLEKLKEATDKLPFASEIYLRVREDNQKHLLELVKQRAAQEDIASFLTQWLIMPEKLRKPEEQETLLAFEQGLDKLLVEVLAMLTERQKNKLLGNIDRYADIIEKLSNE